MLQEENSQKELAYLYKETQSDSKNNSEMFDWASRLTKNL